MLDQAYTDACIACTNAVIGAMRAGLYPPVETRICIKCGEEKLITTFNSSGKCGACRYQEQLMRKRHGGAYSRA